MTESALSDVEPTLPSVRRRIASAIDPTEVDDADLCARLRHVSVQLHTAGRSDLSAEVMTFADYVETSLQRFSPPELLSCLLSAHNYAGFLRQHAGQIDRHFVDYVRQLITAPSTDTDTANALENLLAHICDRIPIQTATPRHAPPVTTPAGWLIQTIEHENPLAFLESNTGCISRLAVELLHIVVEAARDEGVTILADSLEYLNEQAYARLPAAAPAPTPARPSDPIDNRHTVVRHTSARIADSVMPCPQQVPLPKISIITPSYNCARYIRGCIDSVLGQDYDHYEHIVVDGASHDGTVEILKQYPHLQWVSAPDNGEADALNKAMQMASGDIIGWLNADDCYFGRDVFRLVAAEIDPSNGCHAVYGKTLIVDEHDRPKGLRRSTASLTFYNLLRWFNRLDLYQPSVFYSKALVQHVGSYRTDLRYGIDLDYWLRVAKKGYQFRYIDHLLSTMKLFRSDGKTSDPFEVKEKDWLQVCVAHLKDLTPQEQIDFWREYYFFRVSFSGAVSTPLDQYAMTGLLLTLQNTGRIRSALPWLSTIGTNYAEVADIQLLLAEAQATGGQAAEAATIYERALSLELERRQSATSGRLSSSGSTSLLSARTERSAGETHHRIKETRMAGSSRVLFVNRPDALRIPGGDTEHMLQLKAGLERLGVVVDISCDLSPDPTGYDLVNIFNLLLPKITLRQVRAIRERSDLPIVLTPFFWDRSEALWGEAAVPHVVAAAASSDALEQALHEIAAGTYRVGRLTRSGRNTPYAECETEQRECLNGVDHVIPISVRERSLLAATFDLDAGDLTVVPTGVCTSEQSASPGPFVAQYGVKDFVLATGRVETRKNQLMLLMALRETGLPVVIAGAQVDAGYLSLCRKMAPPDTRFVGRLDQGMLQSARAAARVHALPSWWECAGIASMEAALAGCNVVMGNHGAEPEYFGADAYYCRPSDVISIRQAVVSAYGHYDGDAQRRIALDGSIRAQYSWDVIAGRTLEVYRDILRPNRRVGNSTVTTATRGRGLESRDEVTLSEIAVEHLQAAEASLANSDFETAREHLIKTVSAAPKHPGPLAMLSCVKQRLGDLEGAHNDLLKVISLSPDNAEAHAALAAVQTAMGNSKEAEMSARRTLELGSTNISALKVLAKICLDTERYQEAVQTYTTILQHAPNDIETLILVGNCYAETGRFEQARGFYGKALGLDPGNQIVRENLAEVDKLAAAASAKGEMGTVNGSRSEACPSASIVVVTYNSAATVRACLDSVLVEARPRTELVVVDNASTDETRTILEGYRDRATLILNSENHGFSAACNQGVRASTGQYVALLNPDTVVTPGWLDRLISHIGPGVGAVGPVSNYVAGLQKYQLYDPGPSTDRTVAAIAERMAQANYGRAVETRLLIGFCFLIPRKVLDEVGSLDEELFLGNDDLDLSWRLRLKGYKLLVATDAFIHHEGQVSFKSESETKTSRFVQESTDRLYAKLEVHYGAGNVPSPMELWGIDWFRPTKSPHPPFTKGGNAPRTSIIILTYNGLEHTKKCLTSIEALTPESHELILIDNGSTDGTLDYLRDYAESRENVRVIANWGNRGFAAGNNQGLAQAQGNYLLLLNNDTVVTSGWLGRMLAVFDRHPEVGIVGPVSNYVIDGPQLLKNPTYASILEMQAFASRWAADHAGQSRPIKRVVGFCLLMRKAVVDRIGGLDERFGSGNFEDDDFCLRAAQVGFAARVAEDVFIHHTGSQTFKATGIDYRQSMERNWELFKAKWGIPMESCVEQGYRLPLRLVNGSDLAVSLPDLGACYDAEMSGRWLAERPQGGASRPVATVQETVESSRTECCTVVVRVDKDHPRMVWQSLALTTDRPLVIALSDGDGVVGDAGIVLPGGSMLQKSRADAVRLLNGALECDGDDPVVLLSTDLVLTEGWFDRLRAALADDPTLAIVAPTAGQAPKPQRITPRHEGVGKSLRRFTRHRRHEAKGRLQEADYLGGFCLVLNRDACRSIGGLKEDLDLATALLDLYGRLRVAGYRLAVALDVYVHHETLDVEEGADFDQPAQAELAWRHTGAEDGVSACARTGGGM